MTERAWLPAHLRRNIAWQYGATIGSAAAGGLYFLMLGRILGARTFGVYSLCMAVATLTFAVLDLRLQEATIRFAPADGLRGARQIPHAVAFILGIDVGTRILALGVAAVLGLWAAHFLIGEPAAYTQILAASGALFLARCGNGTAVGLLRLTNQFDRHAQLVMLGWLAKLVVTAGYAARGPVTLVEIFVIAAVADGATNLASLVLGLRRFGRVDASVLRALHAIPPPQRREMLRFMFTSNAISLADIAVREGDTWIVGWFLPLESVGTYRMTKNVVMMGWRVADPMFVIAMPEFTRLQAAGDAAGTRLLARRMTGILAAGLAIVYVVGAVSMPWLVEWVLGAEFAQVVSLFPIMGLCLVVGLPFIWAHALAAAAGRPGLQLGASLIANVSALVLMLVLTPSFGVVGASVAFAVGMSLAFPLGLANLRRAKVI